MCENDDDDDDGIFYEAQPAMVENGFINGNTYTNLPFHKHPQTPTYLPSRYGKAVDFQLI